MILSSLAEKWLPFLICSPPPFFTPFMPTMYVKVFKHQSLLPKVLFVTAVSDDVFIFKLIFKET